MSENELLQAPAVKYNNLQSYRLIELVAQWEGRLTANHLSDVFGDSRSTATQLIQSYIEQCPDSLIYNPAIKGYEATEEFIPSFCSGTLDEYMQLMRPYLSQNTTGTQVQFNIEPDPRLSPERQRIVALDYDMNTTLDGRYKRTYRVRAALLTYWLQHLRLDRYREKAEGQQIIISPESQITLAPYMPK